jgi:CheY-like chemotaxis protein
VIDDNEVFRNTMKDLLEAQGFVVSVVGNPVKALEQFNRDRHICDLVLLDYFMPQMDGAKTFEWLRKINPDIKIILCSGADELRLRQIQAQYQVQHYIRKPFRTQELVNLIYRVMGRPLPPAA